MNTTETRELSVAELDLVGGGARIELHLPGKVNVQLDTASGCWSVWLAGKEYAYGNGGKC